MAGRQRTIKVTVVGDESSLARAFGRAGRSAGLLQGKLGKLAGIAGIGGLVIGIKKAGEAVVGMAGSFEESLAKIVGLVGVNREQVQAWGDDILKMAPKVGKSANELADALFFITSAGIRDSVEAMEVLEAAGRAAAAGLGETKDVAFAVVSAMNAYGPANLSAAQATDILVNTVRAGNLEAGELAGSIGKIIPIASAFGVSFDEVGASIAAMTRTGVNSSEAVTNLTGIMKVLVKPTSQANKALADMGLSAEGLRQQVRDEGLLSVLQTLSTKLEGNDDAFGKVFGRVQGMIGFLSLMGENAEINAGIFEDLANSTGVLDEAFDAAAETANFAFRAALAELQSAGITLGAEILPALVDFVEEITPKLVELIPQFADLAVSIIDVSTAIVELISPLVGPLGAALIATADLLEVTNLSARELAASFGFGSKSMVRFNRILDVMARQGLTTGDALEDAKRVIRILATEGLVTEAAMAALKDEFGLTEGQLVSIARESRAWSSDLEGLDEELERVGIGVRDTEKELSDLELADKRAQLATQDFTEATEDNEDALKEHEEQVEEDTEEVLTLAGALQEASEAQESLTEVIKRAADPLFNLVGEVIDYVELLEDVQEEGGITAEEQFKLAEAGFEVAAAFEAMSDPEDVLEAMDLMAVATGGTRESVALLLSEFGIFVDEAGNISSDIADGLLDGFIGLGERMAVTANREIGIGLGGIKRFADIRSPSGLFKREIGRPISEGIAEGILEGMKDADSALLKLTDQLRNTAESGLSDIMSGISAVTGRRGQRGRLRDAEEDVAELKTEKELLPARIAAAKAAITEARAIEDLDDRARALTDAQEELADARQRAAEIDQDILDAADDLLGAQLGLVSAQRRLVEVGKELLESNGDSSAAFIQLATDAGLSNEAIGALLETLTKARHVGGSFQGPAVGGAGTDPITGQGSALVNAFLATTAGSPARAALVDFLFGQGAIKGDAAFWKNTQNPGPIDLDNLQRGIAAVGLTHGGIATRATRAVVGEGDSDEAIIPLNEQGIEFLAAAIRRSSGVGMSGGDTFNINTTADPMEVAIEIDRHRRFRGLRR